MMDHAAFDPFTSPFDRTFDELWGDYGNPADRQMRDLVFGRTPEDFERSCLKQTRYITREQLYRLYNSILFANYQGAVLNVELTISWKLAGYEGISAVERAFNRFQDRFRKLMAYHGSQAYYYAVFEDSEFLSYHSHHALHVPNRLRSTFDVWRKKFARELQGSQPDSTVFDIRVHKEDHVVGQWRWFQYCMKGLDPGLRPGEETIDPLRRTANGLLGVRKRETGYLPMDRVRISRAMGPKAQAKAGYVPPFRIDEVADDVRYGDSEYRRGEIERQCRAFKLEYV